MKLFHRPLECGYLNTGINISKLSPCKLTSYFLRFLIVKERFGFCGFYLFKMRKTGKWVLNHRVVIYPLKYRKGDNS